MVADFVLRDRSQPAAKGVPGPVPAKSMKVHGYRLKHLLKNVRNLLRREVHLTAPMPDQRRIEYDEPVPSLGIIDV
jgi:hypothetical protein